MAEVTQISQVRSERIVTKIGERLKEAPVSKIAPIGIYDSGLGGLTVLSQINKMLPNEDVIFIADTARLPYGGRPAKEIIKFNHQIIQKLIKEGVKIIIIACGTSSAIAYPVMQQQYPIGIVSLIGPGSRAAAAATKNGRIGLIATVGTVNSGAYQKRLLEIKSNLKVFSEAAPLFVPLIEGGFIDTDETKKVAKEYLKPLMNNGIDTLILGCTHYPHLSKIIQKIVGPKVTLIDPAEGTVLEAKKILQKKQLLTTAAHEANYEFLVTGPKSSFKDLAGKLMGKSIKNVKEINLG